MSNNLYQNKVPTEQSQLPNGKAPYSSTTMKTVVGNTQVANCSYDIQGNPVDSTNDTPIDANALQGVTATESNLRAPSTGYKVETK